MAAITEVLAGREEAAAVDGRAGQVARNLLLFLAAPWIGLAYFVMLPLVGFVAILGAVLRRR